MDMYQKRKERQENSLKNEEQGGVKKNVINWYPRTYGKSSK